MDMGQKDFGELLGVGAGYISEIESGKKEPSVTLRQLFKHVAANHNNEAGTTPATTSQTTIDIDKLGKEKEEMMYRLKFEDAQQRIITLLEEKDSLRNENAELRQIVADGSLEKKAGKQRKSL